MNKNLSLKIFCNSRMESTFLITIKEIIEKFDCEYPTIVSLQKIVEKIDILPQEEKIQNYTYIAPIKDVISSYGKEKKRLTDTQANRILDLLRSAHLNISMTKSKLITFPTVHTFPIAIKEIIDKFDVEYDTVGSLDQIIEMIDKLPSEQLIKYKEHITKIKSTINEYGKSKDRSLSSKQSKRIFKILIDSIPAKLMDRKIHYNTNYNLSSVGQLKFPPPVHIPYYDSDGYRVIHDYPVAVKKFDSDDQISGTVLSLLTDLNRNTLGSTLNTFVVEYFGVVKFLLEDDYNRYKDITNEIEECLQLHTWKCKTDTSAGGFHSEPNRSALVEDLEKIVNKYLI